MNFWLLTSIGRSLFVWFGLNVAFNNLSVILRWCLDVAGSSMLTFRVLPHWNIMPQTLWHDIPPIHIILILSQIYGEKTMLTSIGRSLFVWFGLNVAFNNLSVILRWCLDVAGSSMLTFRVLPHWNIMPQTLWHDIPPIHIILILSWPVLALLS